MERVFRSLLANSRIIAAAIVVASVFFSGSILAQTKKLNGYEYTKYKRKYFKPKKSQSYSLFVSPVLTVDPLGVGGRTTYAFGAGGTLDLWQSKSVSNALQGLKLQSMYIGAGFEKYPQSFDKLYFSVGFRIKTFIPIAARAERILDIGDKIGSSSRFCLGLEIKKITVFVCGVTDYSFVHPYYESKYSNAGAILLVIPVYSHIGKFKK